MEDTEYQVAAILQSCINTRIIGVHEDDDAVFLYLDDGQVIRLSVSDDGGFNVDVQPGVTH